MIHRYHDATKHHFHRFARALGYLDWASQPHPFRSFRGAPVTALPKDPSNRSAGVDLHLIGDVLRHSLAISAWKRYGQSTWALRVNPSSGNLHPTEAYVVAPLAGEPAVFHYAADRHVLERRCALSADAWRAASDGRDDVWLVALTSIHWREAWKYGERAFRYCQHDLGHAIAAISIAADLTGRKAMLLSDWPHAEVAALAGIDRDADFVDAEREEPECLLAIGIGSPPGSMRSARRALVDAARGAEWTGQANQLSEDHVEWPIIDEAAKATADSGRPAEAGAAAGARRLPPPLKLRRTGQPSVTPHGRYSRDLLLQRRSALSFDGRSSIERDQCVDMLQQVTPRPRPPWDALWWPPCIHLAIFVHRVDGLEPGLYLLVRSEDAIGRLHVSLGRDFLWESADDTLPLFRLARGDCRQLAQRLSCDQDIAADGFFSLGMIADFDASLQDYGPAFYRHLFWESGVVGQVLYLEAERAGARATGIGCFYDDPVHDVLGIADHSFQSLYHFTVGMPVEDARLTTEPAYP